ncbi:hypothetical protein COT42_05115 [Candidatus Saganbacteria bacterium CG08_land_8_20_14_0_20_45_16]|uniref:Fibronectin type-III domain-containing protein n=1 Tax=Candidatus Saganbacteria bacterium CG08_land_8_20_14_0_20_45_16 TaxID=2014293 RepID=A0A2H0XX52_UNCSA|nr:MAG: hypothetical protein COT42_05115 [Candidatus Saganbacteria bacterium CG08_land_8_20_14_0_20_45_16]
MEILSSISRTLSYYNSKVRSQAEEAVAWVAEETDGYIDLSFLLDADPSSALACTLLAGATPPDQKGEDAGIDGDTETDAETVDADPDQEVSDADPDDEGIDADPDDEVVDADPDQETDSEVNEYCTSVPSEFSLSRPANGRTDVILTPGLEWNPSVDEDGATLGDTVTYTLIVATSRAQLESLTEEQKIAMRDGELDPDWATYFETNISDTTRTLPPLATDTQYYWVVLAHDLCDEGDHIVTSSINNFRTLGGCETAPTEFDLIGPSDLDGPQDLRPTFFWAPSDPADEGDTVHYRLEISPDGHFPPLEGTLITYNDIPASALASGYTITAALETAHAYSWRVVAIDNCLRETVSSGEPLSFTTIADCSTSPSDFLLEGPGAADLGATRVGLTPTLRWHESLDPDFGDTVTYTVHLYRVDGETEAEVYTEATTGDATSDGIVSYSLAGRYTLLNDTVYRWEVSAEDGCHNPAEAVSSFYFQTIRSCSTQPDDFTLIGPSDHGASGEGFAIDDLALSWNPSIEHDPGDEVTYRVYITTTSGAVVFDQEGITGTLINISDYAARLNFNTEYVWHVESRDSCGLTGHSNELHFFTMQSCDVTSPTAPALTGPVGADVVRSPNLTWTASVDPDSGETITYRVYVVNDETDAVIVDGRSTTDTHLDLSTIGVTLDYNTSYRWYVETTDACGNPAPAVTPMTFTTERACVTIPVADMTETEFTRGTALNLDRLSYPGSLIMARNWTYNYEATSGRLLTEDGWSDDFSPVGTREIIEDPVSHQQAFHFSTIGTDTRAILSRNPVFSNAIGWVVAWRSRLGFLEAGSLRYRGYILDPLDGSRLMRFNIEENRVWSEWCAPFSVNDFNTTAAMHNFRIEARGLAYNVYIDDGLVAGSPFTSDTSDSRNLIRYGDEAMAPDSDSFLVYLRYYNAGDSVPFATPSIYDSRVFDLSSAENNLAGAGATIDLSGVIDGTTPVTVSTRTGNSSAVDGTWSAWSDVGPGNRIDSPQGRYIQVRLTLTAPAGNSPKVDDFVIRACTYSG